MTSATPRRAMIVGFLSTVGDIEVLRNVEARLRRMGIPWDVSPYSYERRLADPSWVDARRVDPRKYTHFFVVCGPFSPELIRGQQDIFDRFAHCTLIGVNLTMVCPPEANPFDALIERDGARRHRPDLSLLEAPERVPVAGLCLVGPQPEYGARGRREIAEHRLRRLIAGAGLACIELDTGWPAGANRTGIAGPAQFEAIVARLDLMLTTRLHGLVLSLKNGVPVIALDAVQGGDKVTRQALTLGWPEVFPADEVTDRELDEALARCLQPAARERARACAKAGREMLGDYDAAFALAVETRPRARTVTPVARLRNFARSLHVAADERLDDAKRRRAARRQPPVTRS